MTKRDQARVGTTPPGLSTACVVVVDDQPANVALISRVLDAAGIDQVHAVTDPRDAVDTCLRVEADLVILDLHMPHMDGFAVMAQLKAALAPDTFLPIVVVTADTTADTRRRALAAGADDFLTKPLDAVEVELRVRNLLRTAQLHSDLERRVDQRTQQLARANDQLRALDQMKGDFIALVSHEMRTPLTVINGFAELMGHQWSRLDHQQQAQQVAAVQRNAARLQSLIDNLLHAAALIHDTPTGPHADGVAVSVDVQPLLVGVVRDVGLDPADVSIDCPPHLHAYIDHKTLQCILTKLLHNAHTYGRPPVLIAATSDTAMLHIVVSDHGPGIPAAFAERLFDQFTQASAGDRRTATGAGLGLWIARTLARAHGGDLRHESDMPGATFRLQLPHGLPSC